MNIEASKLFLVTSICNAVIAACNFAYGGSFYTVLGVMWTLLTVCNFMVYLGKRGK